MWLVSCENTVLRCTVEVLAMCGAHKTVDCGQSDRPVWRNEEIERFNMH